MRCRFRIDYGTQIRRHKESDVLLLLGFGAHLGQTFARRRDWLFSRPTKTIYHYLEFFLGRHNERIRPLRSAR